MVRDEALHGWVSALIRSRFGKEPHGLELTRSRIRVGLESPAVERIVTRYRDPRGRARSFRFIAKQLLGAALREAHVYSKVVGPTRLAVAPDLLAVKAADERAAILLLEDVRRVSAWPWRDIPTAHAVLQRLARFHERARTSDCEMPLWDYESELQASAQATLEQLESLGCFPEYARLLRRTLRPLRRLTLSIPRHRERLLRFAPFGAGPIHGDVHPGNVLVRRRRGAHEPVLIDWARARVGSPLEDVSSWLQCLGYWEPQARRKHDTLLAGYLRSAEPNQPLSSDLRGAYWVAAASNTLAGALRYYCWQAASADSIARRNAAAHAVQDCL